MDSGSSSRLRKPVVNADGSKMTYEAITWINPKDGLMEKAEHKIKDVPTQFGPLEISMTFSASSRTAPDRENRRAKKRKRQKIKSRERTKSRSSADKEDRT